MEQDTIVAVATPAGTGGIAVIRLSGPRALEIADNVWRGKKLSDIVSHTVHLGVICNRNGEALDQSLATVFRGPNSFTGEDTVEFSVHGSPWIQREVVNRLVEAGARPAEGGEFSRRAFMNGRLDLAQAEGVADLIAASSRAAHRLAMSQMRGNFSTKMNELRDNLVNLTSLLELELDFSEEDVEFADREKLAGLLDELIALVENLAASYRAGRVLKEGLPVVIAGRPNVGKSTLLNRLLGDDKAIVSDIPGTTRDVIEDTREIGGVLFRFYDTAGLRDTEDAVEKIGIDRAKESLRNAQLVLWLVDSTADVPDQIAELREFVNEYPDKQYFLLLNKSDLLANTPDTYSAKRQHGDVGKLREVQEFAVSAKEGEGIPEIERAMIAAATYGLDTNAELIVTNARHHEALRAGAESLHLARQAMAEGISPDFIAQYIREATYHLGTVTGAVTTDTLLTTIFSRFCIGK